jgi:hypothetical protein
MMGFEHEILSQGFMGLAAMREVFLEEVSGPHTFENNLT